MIRKDLSQANTIVSMMMLTIFDRFSALRSPNFRSYMIGQFISVSGSWVQTITLSWLIYQLSGSAVLLGLATFLTQGPQLVLTPFWGAYIESLNKKQGLIIVQGLSALLALILAGLAFGGWLGIEHLIIASAITGLLNSVDTPLRQSLIIELLDDPNDISNAIAFHASVFTTARLVGPPVGGLLLSLTSPAWCFLINGFSFAALILLLYKTTPHNLASPKQNDNGNLWQNIVEGLRYVNSQAIGKLSLIILGLVNLTVPTAIVLAPALVAERGGDSRALGMILGSSGLGALFGTFIIAGSKDVASTAKLQQKAAFVGVIGLLILCLGGSWEFSLLPMFLIGVGLVMTNVSSNALLQVVTEQRFRSRVVSLFASVRFGFDALGGLIAGAIAHFIGLRFTLAMEALALLFLLIYLMPKFTKVLSDSASETLPSSP